MRDYTISGPGGRELTITGPEDATPAQLRAAAEKAFAIPSAPAPAEESFPQKLGRSVLNVGAGAIRGAGSIGATLMRPFETGAENEQRRADMTGALGNLGADTNSLAFGVGKIGSEIAGTAGVGGAIARGAGAIPKVAEAVPNILQAIRSWGLTGGGGNAMQNALVRAVGGATASGAATALVDPSEAAKGAAIGAALPFLVQGVGKVGGAVGTFLRSRNIKNGDDLAKALDLLTPEQRLDVIAQLRSASELVSGSSPTVAQALGTPQAGILERVVSDTPGGIALKNRYVAQNEARKSALEGVSPTNPTGLADARTALGQTIERYVRPEEARLSREAGNAFEQIDPNGVVRLGLPLGQMQGAVDKYLGPGTFGQGRNALDALSTANKIGTVELPAVKAATGAEQTLGQFVKSSGGINRSSQSGQEFRGELKDLMESGAGRFSFKDRGKSLERMAEAAHEAGFIPNEDPVTLLSALKENPRATASGGGLSAQRAYEAGMGDLPLAERIAQPVPWSEFHSLRTSVGDAWNKARSLEGNSKETAALAAMKKSLDETAMNAAIGRGEPGDFMPADAMAKFLEANKSWAALQERFHTGPQANIFRMGGDGQPAKQGGEIAQAFWGNRPGLQEDVQSFKRLIGDMPGMLGQFRSMVTTEGLGTQTNAGNLSGKFVKWVQNTLPGLREAFEPKQVDILQRIAEDITRAERAASAGMSRGSNTFQNAANALSNGLLDNPLVRGAANKIPGVRAISGPALDWARETGRNAQARRLAELLGDPEKAANALSATEGDAGLLRRLLDQRAQIGVLRSGAGTRDGR